MYPKIVCNIHFSRRLLCKAPVKWNSKKYFGTLPQITITKVQWNLMFTKFIQQTNKVYFLCILYWAAVSFALITLYTVLSFDVLVMRWSTFFSSFFLFIFNLSEGPCSPSVFANFWWLQLNVIKLHMYSFVLISIVNQHCQPSTVKIWSDCDIEIVTIYIQHGHI